MSSTDHNVKNSKYYEDINAYDLWNNLDIFEQSQKEEQVLTSQVININDETIIIEARVPKFKDILKSFFKAEPIPFNYTRKYKILVSDFEETSLSETEYKALRNWLLASDYEKGSGNEPQPTPTQQSHQAKHLVDNYERVHNPALIEAIKKLPKASEILIKLKKELNPEQKRHIKKIVTNIVDGKPVSGKIKL